MKTLIKQIEVLKRATQSLILSIMAHPDYTGEENEEWTDLTTIAQDAINNLKIPHPVIHCKALRKRGTCEYYVYEGNDKIGGWFTCQLPKLLANTATMQNYKALSKKGLAIKPPKDTELVSFMMIEEGGEG